MSAKLAFDVDAFLRAYDNLDRALVAAGFPATSPWWRAELERFFRSRRRRWVIRAGRRAGKSSTLCRLAVCWALAGAWYVPMGDTAVVPFVSLDRDEASGRIRTIGEILTVLHVEHEPTTDEIYLPSKRLMFSVKTCSTRGTVGFTAVAIFGDEMARWESRDNAANPAKDVMGTLRPTMATQPIAFEVCSSSPWGEDDYHCDLVDAGNTDHQIVSQGTTWECNPTISEERTHELEPDPKVWAREYANVPGATISQAFDRDDAIACFTPDIAIPRAAGAFCAIDSSKLRNDEFVSLFGYSSSEGVQVDCIGAWDPSELRSVKLTDIVGQIAARCQERGIRIVFGDDFESMGLTSEFARHHITFHPYAWSEPSKDAAFQTLRRLMRDRRLQIVEHETMRKEMLSCKAHLRPSGRTSYPTNGLDYLSALISAMHAVNDNRIQLVEPLNYKAWKERQLERTDRAPPTMADMFGISPRARRMQAARPLSQSPEKRAESTFPYFSLIPKTGRRGGSGGGSTNFRF